MSMHSWTPMWFLSPSVMPMYGQKWTLCRHYSVAWQSKTTLIDECYVIFYGQKVLGTFFIILGQFVGGHFGPLFCLPTFVGIWPSEVWVWSFYLLLANEVRPIGLLFDFGRFLHKNDKKFFLVFWRKSPLVRINTVSKFERRVDFVFWLF